MSSETGLEDVSLIELFRSEVETHSELLSTALLALERTPDNTSRIDEMMRAAHSIKGAARVVGVEPAVSVAHIMEDCFVAAQKRAIAFSPDDIDILLRGVDLLAKISAATRDPNADLAHGFSGPVEELVAELQAVHSGSVKARKAPAEIEATAVDASPASAATNSEAARDKEEVPPSAQGEVTISFPAILDRVAAEAIRKQVLSAIDCRCSTVRFDLKATKDLDVQGLALLAAVPSHLARHHGPALELAGVSPEMTTVLRVTGLAEAFGVRRDLAREAR